MKHYAILALVSLLLVACATSPTGRRQLMLVSEESAISASREAYAQTLKPLADEGKIDNDPALKKRITTITERLVAQAVKMRPATAKWEWSIKVIDDPEMVNAWCMAGGKMAIYTGDVCSMDSLWLTETESWEGYCVVEEGMIDEGAYMFGVTVCDDVGNYYTCEAGPGAIDNMIPMMACDNVLLRLFDYVDMVPYRVVNVGDNLTAGYWDQIGGDVVKVTADFSNYGAGIGTDGVVNLVPEFDGGMLYYWGYRIDPMPEGDVDQPAGGLGTMVLFEVWDDAGNYNSMWVCPKRIRKPS